MSSKKVIADGNSLLIEVPPSFKRDSKFSPADLSLVAVRVNLLHGRGVIHSLQLVGNVGLWHLPTVMNAVFSGNQSPSTGAKKRRKGIGELAHEITSGQAKKALDAAQIIYSHAIVDATLHQLCKLCSIVSPADWEPLVANKQISYDVITQRTTEQLRLDLITRELEALERRSLPAKADQLLAVIKPAQIAGVLKQFRYSRDRLILIDNLRHELVHKLHFNRAIRQVRAKVDYLFSVGDFFHNLIARKYNIEVIGSPKAT